MKTRKLVREIARAGPLAFLLVGLGTAPAFGLSFFGEVAFLGATDVYHVSCKGQTGALIARVRDTGGGSARYLSVTVTGLSPGKSVGRADVQILADGDGEFTDYAFVARTPPPTKRGSMTGLVIVTRIPLIPGLGDPAVAYELQIHCLGEFLEETPIAVTPMQDE